MFTVMWSQYLAVVDLMYPDFQIKSMDIRVLLY